MYKSRATHQALIMCNVSFATKFYEVEIAFVLFEQHDGAGGVGVGFGVVVSSP